MIQLLINIDVDDLDRAVAFYTEALGLGVGRRLADAMIELTGATSPVYLLGNQAGTPVSAATTQVRLYKRHWTPIHFDCAVDDIQQAVQRAEAAGAQCESGIQTYPYGHLALMSDPFGHGFCLIEFTGRGYGEIALA